jgi:hypothetical protein
MITLILGTLRGSSPEPEVIAAELLVECLLLVVLLAVALFKWTRARARRLERVRRRLQAAHGEAVRAR